MLQHFIIEGKHLGTAEREFSLLQGSLPLSYGFFCHACGNVYAQAAIVGRDWQYWSRTCRKCVTKESESLGLAGSIYLSWDPDFIAAFPYAVLRWEYDRHTEWFERTQRHEQR